MNYIRNIENVSFDQLRNAAFIGQLSSLTKLHLDLDPIARIAVLNGLVAGASLIENLEIEFQADIDQVIKCISQLKQIKILLLKTSGPRCASDAHVIEVAKGLPELEDFVGPLFESVLLSLI